MTVLCPGIWLSLLQISRSTAPPSDVIARVGQLGGGKDGRDAPKTRITLQAVTRPPIDTQMNHLINRPS